MSGIVGYVGHQPALDVVLAGLGRLTAEGPGPDGADAAAAGVAVLADGGLATARTPGTLGDLTALLDRRPLPSCGTGLGRIHAAPPGGAADDEVQPLVDRAGRVAVVQRGTLANGAALRAELAAHGHRLASDTDAAAVARLLAETLSAVGELGEALRLTTARLTGSYAVAAVHTDDPDALAAAAHGPPLLAAVGAGEAVLASEPAGLPPVPGPGSRTASPWRLVSTDDVPGGVLVLRRTGDELRDEVLTA